MYFLVKVCFFFVNLEDISYGVVFEDFCGRGSMVVRVMISVLFVGIS